MARKIRIRTRKNRLPKEFRVKLIVDETDTDNGSFYHCGNCNFVCNDKQDSLGGSKSGDAIGRTDFTIQSAGIISGDAKTAVSLLVNIPESMASLAVDSSGNPKTVVHHHVAAVSGGCPFCGSKNWRADFP